MKNYFKKLNVFLYICVALIVYGCSEEQDFVKQQNYKKIKMEDQSFDKLLQLPVFNDAYQKVVKAKTKITNSTMGRTGLEEQYGFDIVPEVPVRIISTTEQGMYYMLLIERPIKEDLKFENLIINVKDSEVTAAIIKYEMANLAQKIDAIDSYIFDFTDTNITSLVIDGRMMYSGPCVDVVTLMCNQSWTTDGGTTTSHPATAACLGTSYGVDFLSVVTTQIGDCSSGGSSNGPSGPSGATGPAAGSGGATVGSVFSAPLPCIECIVNDETPCPGDPIKKPKICPSSPNNLAGGTYGCTRNDPKRVCEGYVGKKKHGGIDISGKVGDKIYNMHSGTVVGVRNNMGNTEYKANSLGNYIEIESIVDGETIRIKYCHLGNVQFQIGDAVSQSINIGNVGRSGNAAAPGVTTHLHIQSKMKVGNIWTATNPINYFNTTFNPTTFIPATDCN
jgi:Peptidase family M23